MQRILNGLYNYNKEETYEVEIVTPMFLGGADGEKAELRAASIKGLLRFWWRALYGKDYNSIEDMKKREDEIFGSTNKKSSFSIRIEANITSELKNLPKGRTFKEEITNKKTNRKRTINFGILHYLAYGLYTYDRTTKNNIFNREVFMPGNKFRLIINYYNKDNKEEIESSLKALIEFGGIGSRSRNGFGSLSSEFDQKSNIGINKFKNGEVKKFTAFSKETKLFKTKVNFDSWEDALSEIGMAYRNARKSLEPKHYFEKRGFVARPIEAKGERIPNNIRTGRHSKSYFLKVSKDSNSFIGKILYLPFNFEENRQEYLNTYDRMNKKLDDVLQEV